MKKTLTKEEAAAAIEARAKEIRTQEVLRSIHPSLETYGLINRTIQGSYIGNDELKRLRELNAEDRRLIASYSSHTRDEARKAFTRQQDELTADQRAGRKTQENIWSKEEWISDYENRVRAAKTARRAIAAEAQNYITRISERVAVAADELAERVEASEKIEFEKFAVPYVPSRLVWELRAAAFHLATGGVIPPGTGATSSALNVMENLVKDA